MKRPILVICLFTALINIAIGAPVKPRKLYPVDETAQDESFSKFRNELMEAVKKRDKKFLVSVLAPDIHVDFGGGAGVDYFIEAWRVNDPDSKLWDEMETILSLGGKLHGKAFTAPYVFTEWPHEYDSENYYVAVIAGNVSVHLEPRKDSSVVATLSYDIVREVYIPCLMMREDRDQDGITWSLIISLENKLLGFIPSKHIRSPIDYRIYFEKIDGKWKITTFIGGD